MLRVNRAACVPDAVQRGPRAKVSMNPAAESARSGAPLIRDRHGLGRSRVCSASLRAALRPGHAAQVNVGESTHEREAV